jgi:oxygen-independent coproporphyrinogen-3 oxidase
MSNGFSIYVHYPYCRRICPYCDFNVKLLGDDNPSDYVDSLIKEFEFRILSPEWAGRSLDSIYLGGGTPSMIGIQDLARLLALVRSRVAVDSGLEVTIEANPEDISPELADGWQQAGINRVSLGVQAVQERFLRLLKRRHSLQHVREALNTLVAAGIDNLNADYIFALPGQEVSDIESDINIYSELPLTHISTYELTIEQGTPFFRLHSRGKLLVPTADVVANSMEIIDCKLGAAGFDHYEVSNFARAGFESHHNLGYWTMRDYMGLGAGAHSFVRHASNGLRSCNVANPRSYINMLPKAGAWYEELPLSTLEYEFMMVGLRLKKGVSRSAFNSLFNRDPLLVFNTAIEFFREQNLLWYDDNAIIATREGVMILDSVLGDERWVELTRIIHESAPPERQRL